MELKWHPYPPSMDEWAGYWQDEKQTVIAYKARNGDIHFWAKRDKTGAVIGKPIIMKASA